MIVLDTSVLVGSLAGEGRSFPLLERLLLEGASLLLPALTLYEWRRGPRTARELESQESAFPSSKALPFGPAEAEIASSLYKQLPRARGREMDIAIAATAIAHGAGLWTLNPKDFADIPGLKLVKP
jgi:predicted nucleic acid-binding protein